MTDALRTIEDAMLLCTKAFGQGVTTALASTVKKADGWLVCASTTEARRVERDHGLFNYQAISLSKSRDFCGFPRDSIVLFDTMAIYSLLSMAAAEIRGLRQTVRQLEQAHAEGAVISKTR